MAPKLITRYYSVLKEIYELRRNQHRRREEIERIQEKVLKKLITHSYINVPIYKSKFKSVGIKPTDIGGLKDLSKIPLMAKKEMKDAPFNNRLGKGVDPNKCKISFTSGTIGVPMKIFHSPEDLYYSSAREYYIQFECGIKVRDKIVSLRVPRKIRDKLWFEKLGFLNIDTISIRQLPQKIIEEISKARPDVIISYPSIYLTLSTYVKDCNINPRLGFSSGEPLNDNSRQNINSDFNIELFDLYGTTETNRVAFECKQHDGLHIISDHNIIEFLKDGEHVSPGERGEIVVTSLHNYAMPFIRYRLGDFGVPSDELCSCGRTYPLIKKIEGRQDDFLTLPSGRIISPRNINILEYIKGITEFQIIQEKKDKFLIYILKDKDFSENTISEIKQTIKSGCLGEDVNVEVKILDKIKRGRTGKIRNVISNV